MSWLNIIVEGILNEIGADDAYNRFYNSIPRDKYNEILDGETNVDKFMTFILNGVRDDLCDAEDAIMAVRAYKQADPLVRQAILNNFRNGDYESAIDVYADINYLAHGGGVINKNKFAKEGYIKLGGDENWLVTCTTNYQASNHYFGDTHWCTASDREGNYDGYEMFKRYVFDQDAVLIQISSKTDPMKKWQIQCYMPSEADYDFTNIGQVCDFMDNGVHITSVVGEVDNEKLTNVLRDKEIISELFKIRDSQKGPEAKYQEKQEEIIKKKEARRLKRLKKRHEEVKKIVDAKNAEREEKIQKQWNEFLENNLYENLDFINKIWERDILNGDTPESEEEADATYHVAVSNIYLMQKSCAVLEIGQVGGGEWFVDDVNTDNGTLIDFKPNCEFETSSKGRFYIIGQLEGDENDYSWGGRKIQTLLGIGKPSSREETGVSMVHNFSTNDVENRFALLTDMNGNDCFFDSVKKMVYPIRKYVADGRHYRSWNLFRGNNDDIFILDCETGWGDTHKVCGIFILTADGDYWYDDGEIAKSTQFFSNRGIYIGTEGRAIIRETFDTHVFDFKVPKEVSSNILDIRYLGELDNDDYFALYTKATWGDGYNKVNVVSSSDSQRLIFGVWGKSAGLKSTRKAVRLTIEENGETNFIYYFEDFSYVKRYADDHEVPCNKYGKTKEEIEKERIAKKNFADWEAAGGHSPESQSDMDKMWQEYGGNTQSSNSERAFKDWNDDDRFLDVQDGSFTMKGREPRMLKGLQNFPEDERWRGEVGLKDPEGYSNNIGAYFGQYAANHPENPANIFDTDAPDSVRRNPWYRIGKDGKPLDQPWYDEDEVPARLSDRVAENRRIQETLKKTMDLFNRLFD